MSETASPPALAAMRRSLAGQQARRRKAGPSDLLEAAGHEADREQGPLETRRVGRIEHGTQWPQDGQQHRRHGQQSRRPMATRSSCSSIT